VSLSRGVILVYLNFGTIILLQKKGNAIQIQWYRPICCLRFKVFINVRTNLVTEISHSVVRPTQMTFTHVRHILVEQLSCIS
jgi:hypothetical protein